MLGAHLKELRNKQGLFQKDVAKALGYTTVQFISNWERNKSRPPADKIGTLAELYKVTPDFLANAIANAAAVTAKTKVITKFEAKECPSN